MPPVAKNRQIMTFQLGQSDNVRLTHHATRLTWDKAEIIRSAIFERLNQLDEQEAFTRQQKAVARAERSGGVGRVGALPGGVGSGGMPVAIVTPAATPLTAPAPTKAPEKLRNSFRRHAEFVDSAEGSVDRSMRIQTVLDDFRERSTNDEANAAFLEFQELLKQRAAAKPIAVVSVPEGVPISGDVDE